MHLTQIKASADLKLNGVTVEFTTADNSIREVILTSEGRRFVIQKGETYSENLRIYRADKFKQEKRHVVEGEFCGVKINEAFEHRHDAESRLNALKNVDLEYSGSSANLTMTEKTVPVDVETGAVAELDEVPF